MKFVKKHTSKTLEVKQSKFIAHLIPYNMYDTTLKELKSQHPKARHFVVASRYINEFDQIVEHSSDDGEPKGTSGKPTLCVLAGNTLINSAVIVVRYFGGTKLGTGGLVRAYSDACNGVIQDCELFEYVKLESKKFFVQYKDISKIEYLLNEENIIIKDKSFTEFGSEMILHVEKDKWNSFYKECERIIRI